MDEETIDKPLVLNVGNTIKYRRIDRYLHGRFSNYSRVMIQEIIKAGGVKVNGKIVKQSFQLTPKDSIDLVLPELPSNEIEPEDIPIDIIYEDDDIIILNKQANIIVHPARGNKHGTLVNGLAFHCNNLSSGSDKMRPGIVHRLDRNTTGVMVVAKNDIAQWKISKQFKDRQTKKTYLAFVQGCPELTADRISAPLGVHARIREKYAVRMDGKEAITFYDVLEEFRGYSFIQIRIETGRTHQIRVHMQYIRHPVVADDMYDGKLVYPWQLKDLESAIEQPIINRVALHAFSLELKHPTTEKMVRFEAPLPADMQHLLDMLRQFRKT